MKSDADELNQRLSLRVAGETDKKFLEQIYLEARRAEFAAFDWADGQLEALLGMQFEMQMKAYQMQFFALAVFIIELSGAPIGRLIIDRNDKEIRLVDLTILPEFRHRGIGAFLLGELQAEAVSAKKPLNLRVLKTNQPAVKLYERCGFVVTENSDLYFGMSWQNLLK